MKKLASLCLVSAICLFSANLYAQTIPPVSSGTLESLGLDQSAIDAIMSTAGQSATTAVDAAAQIQDAQQAAVQQSTQQTSAAPAAVPEAVQEIVQEAVAAESAPATIWGQDFFRNGSVDVFDKVTNSKVNDNYIIGEGDQFTVAIWGFAYYNGNYTVNEDGYISTVEVGRIYVKGLTYGAAKQLFRQRFASAFDLTNSKFDVSLIYSKTIKVNIVGEVVHPGSYNIASLNTAFNALAAAGGVSDIGSVRNIQIKRNDKVIKTLDVYQFLMNPGTTDDTYLEANDYIIVNGIGKVVEIQGEVNRPLKYELIKGENLNEAVFYAGGLKSTAYKRNVTIYRYVNNENVVLDINIDSLNSLNKNFQLIDGDKVIFTRIPEVVENIVMIQGAVHIPGSYELTENLKLRDVIMKAKGLTYDAYTDRAYLIRKDAKLNDVYIPFNLQEVIDNPNSPLNFKLAKFDVVDIFSKEKFKETFTVAIEGAIKSPGSFPYFDQMTLKDVLYYAGGLKVEAANSKIEISRIANFADAVSSDKPTRIVIQSVAINKNLEISDAAENFMIQPYDQIFVRTIPEFEFQRNVVIGGEVKYPGTYTLLSRKEKISDLIERAGGLTNYAYIKGATLSRTGVSSTMLFLDKAMADTASAYNYILKEGDNVFIPKLGEQVIMMGEIRYGIIGAEGSTVMVPFEEGRSARHYVKKFGRNFSDNADRSETYVVQPNGYMQRTHNFLWVIHFYPHVKVSGSSVVVPAKPSKIETPEEEAPKAPFDWNSFAVTMSATLMSFATLYLLFAKTP